MRKLYVVWSVHVLSQLGSDLTTFALGVWMFQVTGSVTDFALISLSYVLPFILLSPVAGSLVDAWGPKISLLTADMGSGLAMFGLLLGFVGDPPGRWLVYVLMAISGGFSALRWPAISTFTTMVVPAEQLGRNAGLLEAGPAAAQLVAPLVAAMLLTTAGLPAVLACDCATFLIAIAVIGVVRMPRARTAQQGRKRWSFDDLLVGWRFIAERTGLLLLLFFVTAIKLVIGFVELLVTPLVLGYGSPRELGLVLTIGGVGMLVGALVMGSWGGPRSKVAGMLGFAFLQGVPLIFGALSPDTPLIAIAAFCILACVPIVSGCSQALWQVKVPVELQGRVFSIRSMTATSALPVSFCLAGPLTEHIFDPWLRPDGALASSVGAVVGTGPGRGIAFFFILLGVLCMLLSLAAWLHPRVRHVEAELPDAPVETRGG